VKESLIKYSEPLKLTEDELKMAFQIVDELGWQPARPSKLAGAIIKILKPNISNPFLYKTIPTEFNTLRKWVIIICDELKIKQIYFK
jgi:hypothetical protein